MTANNSACFICSGDMTVVREHVEFAVGKRTATVPVERLRCEACDEVFYTPAQARAAQSAAADELRRQDGLLTPTEIRVIRTRNGLSQSEMEQLLGVGPKTVVRWERGTVFQNRATDKLLRVIDRFPAVCAQLMLESGIVKKGALPALAPPAVAAGERVVSFRARRQASSAKHFPEPMNVFPARRGIEHAIALTERTQMVPGIPKELLQ